MSNSDEEFWYIDPATLEWVGPFKSEAEAEEFREEDYERYLSEEP